MRSTSIFLAAFVIAVTVGCSNVSDVTLAGPSVPDQLNGRGYIATPADTTLPADTTVVDTLH